MFIIAIDASYLEISVCRKWDIRIDYLQFVLKIIKDVLGHETDNWRAYIYCNSFNNNSSDNSNNTEDFAGFINYLGYLPRFIIKTGKKGKKTFTCEKCGHENELEIQKTVDVSLVIDMIKLAEKNLINQFILVAGDQDFVPLLEELLQRGIITAVVGVEGSQAMELRCASDYAFMWGKKDFDKIKSQKKRQK